MSKSASSILVWHMHNNCSIERISLAEEVVLYKKVPPTRVADLFIKDLLANCFSQRKRQAIAV